MEITDVRVKLISEPNDRLRAVCSVTLDDVFVVRDLKVVDGSQGLFVAMPSRKLTSHCPRCRSKNHLRAKFCNDCGSKLPPVRTVSEGPERTKLHRDIAHPITTEFREQIQVRLLECFNAELEQSREPGYRPQELDDADGGMEDGAAEKVAAESSGDSTDYDSLIAGLRGRGAPGPRSGDVSDRRNASERKERPPRRQPGGRDGAGSRRRSEKSGSQRGDSAGFGRRASDPVPAPPRPAPTPPPARAPEPTPTPAEVHENNDEPFGAGIL